MSQGLVSITDTNKSTIAKRKTAPKPKLMTHHKKANFWNCIFGLLWQQGKYSSNGFAQMHLHQRWWCTTVKHIAAMHCNGTRWQSGLLRSKESQSAKRIGLQLSTVCQIVQRAEMALRRNCKNTKEFHFSTSLVQHLQISSCHQFVQSHTRELSWLTPPTSHLSVCVNPCHLILQLKPFSAQRVVAAPRLIRTNPLESRQSPWRATSASQGSARPSKGPLSNYWGSSFYADSQEGFSKICCNY